MGFPLGDPAHGHAQGLVAEFADVVVVPRNERAGHVQLPGLVGGPRVLCGRRILGCVKRVPTKQKKLQHTLQDTAGEWVGIWEMHGPTSPGSAL